MITKIKVDGFKSLNDFELEVMPGLNILVGPNGSGKTNIILFLEFLSYIVSHDIHSAVTKVGGAGSIFRKMTENSFQQSIKCSVEGCKKVEKEFIQYIYNFSINISFDKDYLYFSDQSYKAKRLNQFTIFQNDAKWGLILKQVKSDDNQSLVEVEEIDIKNFKPRFIGESQKNIKEIIEISKRYLSNFNSSTSCLIQAAFSFDDRSFYINQDFQGGETFNIIPSKVKQPEDSANPPGIKKDGSGLANTLYAMKKNRSTIDLGFNYPFYFRASGAYQDHQETLKKIIENIKLANSAILDIDVSNDQFNNQLVVKVYIKDSTSTAVLPLSVMSDGTIKWITLITAILSSKEVFSIEEPENFLHPWMQAEIVNIIRNTFNSKDEPSFVLMTTHSETLLNYSKPNELIIISLTDNKTLAKRIQDVDLISKEIEKTGFGLGYYYVSNALTDE